jgi:hypothetical protein
MTILLIGSCGSGKTWVMENILSEGEWVKAKLGLFRFSLNKENNLAVMGVYDKTIFQGSDRLSMGLMKDVDMLLMSKIKNKLNIICEGDRFTNRTFISKLNPIIIKIMDDGSVGRKRRKSTQTERHIKSIQTRVNNIEEHYKVPNSLEALLLIKKILKDYENNST